MTHHPHSLWSRRRWLTSASTLLGAAALPSMSLGQTASGYKALVCVFLYGGNDSINCLVPTDSRYAAYQSTRKGLALASSQLKPLDGVPFGLHPALAPLQAIWNRGAMTALHNVGPLIRPFASKEEFRTLIKSNSPAVTPRLFSHSDQQIFAQAASGEPFPRTGWGGRAITTLTPNGVVYTLGGNAQFGASSTSAGLTLPGSGRDFYIQGVQNLAPNEWEYTKARSAAFKKIYDANRTYNAELMEIFVKQQNQTFALSEELATLIKQVPKDMTAGDAVRDAFFGLTTNGTLKVDSLSDNLFQVAKLIRYSSQKSTAPQIYFVQMGGFDTHGDQLDRHQKLLTELGQSLAAFQTAMDNVGLGQSVTTFTESDFGRTLAPNNSGGTDHAWGATQFIMGGAVVGKQTYGTYPSLVLGGPDDVGVDAWERQGRWIPTTSIEQYAATLLNWLGASPTQQGQILPNLKNFNAKNLGFLA